MKRTVITVDGNGRLSIPSNLEDLWMSESELIDMLYVTAPKLKAVIRAIYKAGFVDERDKEKAKKDLETAKEKAEKSVRTIELREQDANENTTLNRVFNEIKESYRPEISNTVISVDSVKQEEKNKKEDKKYLTQNLSKYNKREQKLGEEDLRRLKKHVDCTMVLCQSMR